MASVPQSPFFSSLNPMKQGVSPTKLTPINFKFKTLKLSSSLGPSNGEFSSPNSSNSPESSSEAEPAETDPVKLAFAKAKSYKKTVKSSPTPQIVQDPFPKSAEIKDEDSLSAGIVKKSDGLVSEADNGKDEEVPLALKLAMEKAKEYKKNKGLVGSGKDLKGIETTLGYRNEGDSAKFSVEKEVDMKEEIKISSIDFMGLDFADKRSSRGLPPGLVPVVDPFPEGDLPEVEIIVGDTSKFGDETATEPKPTQEEKPDLYKPKVSTWGVFPRPSDISKTYGGGRTIRPGDMLETAEDKAAKEAQTKKLLSDYKRKIGLSIDPKLKFECKKALNDGDSLMDLGKLKEALPFYEIVMDKLAFQSELHGLAALQWSICQDSLSRPNEAGVMYEKLKSHPNAQVSKKARQFMFGFQAMEMMKVKSSYSSPSNTGYQNYFEAFVEDKANYSVDEAEDNGRALTQVLPYVIFLVSPIFVVLLIAVQKGI